MTQPMLKTMSRYVDVLEQRAQTAQAQAGQAQQQLQHTTQQLERLRASVMQAELKKSTGNVALYANAAGFRTDVLAMVEQMRDAHSVQELECARTHQQMQLAMRRLGSMDSVLVKVEALGARERAQHEQKTMDEMATQAWLRQQAAINAEIPETHEP